MNNTKQNSRTTEKKEKLLHAGASDENLDTTGSLDIVLNGHVSNDVNGSQREEYNDHQTEEHNESQMNYESVSNDSAMKNPQGPHHETKLDNVHEHDVVDEDSVDSLSLSDSILSEDSHTLQNDDIFAAGLDPTNDELSSRQAKIIREILANFDLEEVMDRYRGQSVMHSLRKNRQLLEDIMGNEKVPYSDRKWHEAFRQKVLEDLERQQDERERKLAEAESQRVLKLKLQGIIKVEGKSKREEKENKTRPADKKLEKFLVKKHQALYRPNDIETQMQIISSESSRERSRKESVEEISTDSQSPDQGDQSSSQTPTYRSHLGRMKSDNTAVVHPNLEKLYEEEDLDELYKEAENLVKFSTVRSSKK
ncbi:hypothetical protein Btru_072725 [Bulinus truncatus]|nr:hypothetical protein Btru_072725 [Bulinus truncatus]